MKITTIALAVAVALSSTVAIAQTNDRSVQRVHRDKDLKFQLQPNNGNPNGNPNGPTTLSGTGSSQYGGSAAGTSGRN